MRLSIRSSFAARARGRLLAASWLALTGVALTPSGGSAAPEDATTRCLHAYESGQRSRKAGALQEAKAAFALCSSNTCPRALHPDCGRWLDEVEAAIPTGVFRVSARGGGDLDKVSISIDGGPQREIDGRAIAFDPGEHSIVFTRENYRVIERRFTFSEGEKLALRELSLEPLTSASPAQATTTLATGDSLADAPSGTRRATLVPAWIAGSIGVASAAGFAYFATAARSDDRTLDDCTPRCSKERVDKVRREYLLANVSLGVSAASLLAAGAWILFRPSSSATPSARDGGQALELRLGPVTSVSGRF